MELLGGPARGVDPAATARTYFVPNDKDDDTSPFLYQDTASSRAGITALASKLASDRVAIVGLGGTGSYVLDLLAKTHIQEIHLFDGDVLSQHNVFRAPGAASIEQLQERPLKVDYYHRTYSNQRRGIVPHAHYIDDDNVELLRDMSFVFLCMEGGMTKRAVVRRLQDLGVEFIDVGLGVKLGQDQLLGQVRVTLSTATQQAHVWERDRIPFPKDDADNDYDQNIQVADLNALNATLAVIRWKRHLGYYADTSHEYYALYSLDGNHIMNDELAE